MRRPGGVYDAIRPTSVSSGALRIVLDELRGVFLRGTADLAIMTMDSSQDPAGIIQARDDLYPVRKSVP